MDDQTLETLCLNFDHAVTLSSHHTEKVDADQDIQSPEDSAGKSEGDKDMDDNCSSNDTKETCSYQWPAFPVFQKIEYLANKVKIIKKEQALLCSEVKGITADSFMCSEAFTALEKLSRDHDLLKKKYLAESAERKKFYNELIELKGNIRVFCRCRPLKEDEIVSGSTPVVDFTSENELQIISSDASRKQFKFDHVFKPEDNQEAIFSQTVPIVTSVLDGYNVCIFAYGQTGTGKTYTMEGTPESRGVNYRTLEELFRVSNERSSTMRYELSVSMLEVYNEKIRDLLVENSNLPVKKLEIKQSADGTQEVPGLVEAQVYGTDEVWNLLTSGSRARSVGSTNANELSSRSHCLLRVTVVGDNLLNGERIRSHLWLVDLAGSERVGRIEVEGERLKESQFINKSLSALGDVISALASKSSHVPYRNSKLTHMLQSSLGGDCKTLMFVQISPNVADLGETLCSLNFASRVRGVEHGPARKQADHAETSKYKHLVEKAKHDEKEIKKLQESFQSLQLKFSAREHICRNLQEKVRDLENQLAEERKTRMKQENRALATISIRSSALSTSRQAQTFSTDKKPPLAPTNMRLPLRKITNLMPNISPIPSNRKRMMSVLPPVNEDKENISRTLLKENKPTLLLKPRRSSIAVRPAPQSTNQIRQPKRRASVATLQPEIHSSIRTPIQSSTARFRTDRIAGRQSFGWDRQRAWRKSIMSSPLPQSRQLSTATVLSTPVASSSKFRGSPPSQPGSWKPKHPTVIALQKKHLVWSPLKLRGMKNKRNSYI